MTFLIKAFAAVITVLGAAGIGVSYAEKLNERQKYSDEIISDTKRLCDEISIYKTPLVDAIVKTAERGGEFYKEISDKVTSNTDFKRAVIRTLDMAKIQKKITGNQYKLINGLFQRLGEGTVLEQETVIEEFLKSYIIENEEIREERSKGQKLYKIIGTASGLALFLMLV